MKARSMATGSTLEYPVLCLHPPTQPLNDAHGKGHGQRPIGLGCGSHLEKLSSRLRPGKLKCKEVSKR